MAKKKKKKAAPSAAFGQAKSRAEYEADREKKHKRVKLFVLIFAIVALVAVLATVITVVVIELRRGEMLDAMNDDLHKYIHLDPEDYKGFEIDIPADPVDDMAISDAFIRALYKTRKLDPTYNGKYYTSLPVVDGAKRCIQVGDAVFINYIGYETTEDGRKIYFDGGSNIGEEPSELGIGSGSFITGFEYGLVGKDIDGYSRLEAVERPIESGDYVTVNYTVISSDESVVESAKNVSAIVPVDSSSDGKFGAGFVSALIGKGVGDVKADTEDGIIVANLGSTKLHYTDVSVTKIFDSGDNPLSITARFPVSYSNAPELAGKTVTFDVYVDKVQMYTVEEFGDKFVEDHLGMTSAALSAWGKEGDSLEACYRAYLGSALELEAEAAAEELITEALWERVLDRVEIKRLPEGEVLDYYNSYVSDVYKGFEANEVGYSSVDEYAITHYELEAGADWRAHLREGAEKAVTQKIIFHYIIREEGFLPTEEEYKEVYDRVVNEMLEYVLMNVNCKESNYETKEEYEAAVAQYKQLMLDGYGEAYFDENVIYEFAMEKIVKLPKVNLVTK